MSETDSIRRVQDYNDSRRRLRSQTEGPEAARRELADAMRDLQDLLASGGGRESMLREVAAQMRASTEALQRDGRDETRAEYQTPAEMIPGMRDFHDRSPIVGLANPIAPPIEFSPEHENGRILGHGAFRKIHEGAPGIVHGGLLAAVLDELLGLATGLSDTPGMTGTLTIRYHRPTRTEAPIQLEARLDSVEGRRMQVSGECVVDGERTASAEGLFIAVDTAKFAAFEAARRERDL
ncbi:MAG: PaaI family thioesterase [bacterium]|nr:PaaI family thioesterase [bacterium]MCP5069733.1 PaaI family thioesterase [bacterium]